MQVTLDLPETLVLRLPREPEQLAEIFERGLQRTWSATAGLGREVLEFLASGPSPAAILQYVPSGAIVDRSRTLLEKNTSGTLSEDDAAEMDEMAQLDALVALLKAEARKHMPAAA